MAGNVIGKDIGQVRFAAAFAAIDTDGEIRPVGPAVDHFYGFNIALGTQKILFVQAGTVRKFYRQLANDVRSGHWRLFPGLV